MKTCKFFGSVLVLLVAGSIGCSKQAFKVGSLTSEAQSAGQFTIPAKVDVLFAQDNTGSMNEAFTLVQNQLPGFLNQLENSGWDYRFALTPLTTQRPLNQILAAKYDANWVALNQWKPPFPGAAPDFLNSVLPAFFRTLSTYSHFLNTGNINNSLNGMEPGFQTIDYALQTYAPQSSFLRSDAMLIVIALSNGDDTSGVTYCTRPGDGYQGPCDLIGGGIGPNGQMMGPDGSYQQSLDDYEASFQSLVTSGDSASIRFYSAVAFTQQNNCLGGVSKPGNRYQWMASALGGHSYNICSTPINTILSQINSELNQIKLNFVTGYLVIGTEPAVSSIEVIKYIGGNPNQTQVIPHDDTNGWSYIGYQQDFPTIELPIPMNNATGYFIKLNGSAKLTGNDAAIVNFQPGNGTPSS